MDLFLENKSLNSKRTSVEDARVIWRLNERSGELTLELSEKLSSAGRYLYTIRPTCAAELLALISSAQTGITAIASASSADAATRIKGQVSCHFFRYKNDLFRLSISVRIAGTVFIDRCLEQEEILRLHSFLGNLEESRRQCSQHIFAPRFGLGR